MVQLVVMAGPVVVAGVGLHCGCDALSDLAGGEGTADVVIDVQLVRVVQPDLGVHVAR